MALHTRRYHLQSRCYSMPPIAFFLIVCLLWLCVFRAIFRRRRERQSNTAVLPIASNTNTGYYPPSDGYNTGHSNNTSTAQTGYNAPSGGEGGAAASYYNNDAPQMSEAYTKPPQQAYHPSGQGEYAPPSGAPPSGGYGGGYAPPSGAPPTGYSR
ncbi:hypothetical protein QFC21_007102 [Naganishia friedmannii]|uniref:Uncharacterized protein n=1 Tax=Naganishia friedmannii TaxID=89922 RepID=A0ACC2UYH6_9TREE|nr:hypothetical protein QFC21_007102 [Naganishia friedmannii]